MPPPDDWSWLLASAFLDAAVSCGFECDRRYVTMRATPEGMPPGCPCQLVVSVTEGYGSAPAIRGVKCSARRVAEVRLWYETCSPPVGPGEALNPVTESAAAREASVARFAIARGLYTWWRQGRLHGEAPSDDGPLGPLASPCSAITPGPWRVVSSAGGVVRWETLWRYTEDVP